MICRNTIIHIRVGGPSACRKRWHANAGLSQRFALERVAVLSSGIDVVLERHTYPGFTLVNQ